MSALFQQIFVWLIVSALLGLVSGWLLAKLHSNKKQQQLLDTTQKKLISTQQISRQLEKERDECQQNTQQTVDVSSYETKIAILEKAMLDLLKSRK